MIHEARDKAGHIKGSRYYRKDNEKPLEDFLQWKSESYIMETRLERVKSRNKEVVWSKLLHYSKYERGSIGLSNVLNMVGKRKEEAKGDIQEAT